MPRAKPKSPPREHNGAAAATVASPRAMAFDHRLLGYMLRTLSEELPKGRALELGCFDGEFTRRLGSIYDDLTVVEGASDLIGLAKARAPAHVDFVVSRFEDYQPDWRYDAIFLIHTLEHVEDPVALLKQIRGWLTEQGRLFLVVPNANAASMQIADASPNADAEREVLRGHRHAFNLSTLKGAITDAGLFATKSGGVFFKAFSNRQFDQMIQAEAVGEDYLEGCYQLGKRYPDLSASIYAVCEPWSGKPYSRRGSR